jgi:hypothetical protein
MINKLATVYVEVPQHSAAAADPVLVLRGVPDHAGAA